jgi:hypothetical protein
VDLTTVLFTNFYLFNSGISLDGDARDDALDESLAAFIAVVEAAVPSYLGLQMTIGQNGHPVTLTRIKPHRTAATSVRLPLTALGPRFDPGSRVTLYAATAGAFVDLAADLSYALHLPTCTDRSTDVGSSDGDDQPRGQVGSDRRITLDADLPASPLDSGVYELSGLSELSTINRAIGVLIGQGQHPDDASETLRRDAFREGLEPHSYAAWLLERDRADRGTNPRRRVVTPSGNVDDAERRPPALRWRRVRRRSTRIPLYSSRPRRRGRRWANNRFHAQEATGSRWAQSPPSHRDSDPGRPTVWEL